MERKYKVSVATNRVGSKVTGELSFDEEEFDGMTADEQAAHVDEAALEWAHEQIDISCEAV